MDGYNGVQWLATEDDTEASALRAEQDSLKFLGKADKCTSPPPPTPTHLPDK